MKKEDSRDSLIDIPLEDDRDESQLTGRKAAEYNKQHGHPAQKACPDEDIMCAGNIAGTACNPRGDRSDPR